MNMAMIGAVKPQTKELHIWRVMYLLIFILFKFYSDLFFS